MSLFLLLTFPETCRAAELHITAGCRAQWAEEEEGIARVTLTQYDKAGTEMVVGTTDYIFMIDGSRTTALSDRYLFQEGREDQEPQESHCPCMAEGHYYMVGGMKVLPLTYTLGYECDTGELRTWSAERMLWSDSAGAHYNRSGSRIPVRYANGCLDIFTIFKNEAINSIREIAQRRDGSRIAFIVYSGDASSLYGVLDYTQNYEDAIRKIENAGFEPGSLLCPGLDRARALYDGSGTNRTTKLLMMGDGRNTDIESARQKAAAFRALPKTAVYTACMGKEACTMGSGGQAMNDMSGGQDGRFFRVQTRPQQEMSKVFAAALNEEMPVTVSIDSKNYTADISGEWEYYENIGKGYCASCSAGSFSHTQKQVAWQIPKDIKNTVTCSFYVKMKEEAKYISVPKEYDVLSGAALSYVIRGGSRDGQKGKLTAGCNHLLWKPSRLEVTKVKLLSGNAYKKQEDVWYVQGDSENELTFESYTSHATAAWKPEKNILYEKSARGRVFEISEKKSIRSQDISRLKSIYPVTLYKDGEVMRYYPSASIGRGENELFTEKFDETKKLTLICDALPPRVAGSVPKMIREDRTLEFTAEDDGSGVRKKSFVLVLKNVKTGEEKKFVSSGVSISWNIMLEDPFYSGNIRWSLQAEDNVCNRMESSGIANIRPPKGEETIADEIRTRILDPRSDLSVNGIY